MKSTVHLLMIAIWLMGIVAVNAQPFTPAVPLIKPEVKIPKSKWFDGEKGYLEARALQEQSGADIFIYFYNYGDKNQKGLCSWWESHAMQNGEVKKLLQDFIKVRVEFPFKKKAADSFNAFLFRSCPSVYVVKTNGFPQKITVFDWPGSEPKLKTDEELADLIKKASGAVEENKENR